MNTLTIRLNSVVKLKDNKPKKAEEIVEFEISEDVTVEEADMEVIQYAVPLLDNSNHMGVISRSRIANNYQPHNTEEYDHIVENEFKDVKQDPLSTFSIDVDAASYSNVRRFINQGQTPPKDAVRIEEMINYFSYDYDQPKGKHPFSIQTEVGECPWNNEHKLVHIGIQGKSIEKENLPPNNLVFLIDVSGSMQAPNKLELVKKSLWLLVDQMRPQDRIALTVYAGAAGLVLPSTSGEEKDKIRAAIGKLTAGGSTAGAAGIRLAYKVAAENFIKEGNNRVILATDGDFNVGVSSNGELSRMIEEKRSTGVYLTVLGYGMGNYKDSKMEQLADKGNGNYAYIDNLMEAKKVLVNEMGATLLTIAKDVKLQIEFNPQLIKQYKLIGYENRMLNKEDFNDDKKDAGELGAGHTVTALYEVVLVGGKDAKSNRVDALRYQSKFTEPLDENYSDELMTIKFRYKPPKSDESTLITEYLKNNSSDKLSQNYWFSAAVAEFGLLLRDSKMKGDAKYSQVIDLARKGKGEDKYGYRAEFIRMVEMMELQANSSR